MSVNEELKSAKSGGIPFYELPAHVVACSKIIEETRKEILIRRKSTPTLQSSLLRNRSSSSSVDWDILEDKLTSSSASRKRGDTITPPPVNVKLNGHGHGVDHVVQGTSSSLLGGGCGLIKPVFTTRPFTPRDANLWGKSARKRPPSAITLSRLIIDENEELSQQNPPPISQLTQDELTKIELCKEGLKNLSISPITTTKTDTKCIKNLGEEQTKVLLDSKKSEVVGVEVEVVSQLGSNGAGSIAIESLGKIDTLQNSIAQFEAITSNSNFNTNTTDGQLGNKAEILKILEVIKSQINFAEGDSAIKKKLLRLVFRLVEKNQNDPDILFWASFILLHCKIVGNNLTTIFKMVFKASRSKEYWILLQDSEYLEIFMENFAQICPCSQTESMIYGYGTLKFLCTSENSILHRVLELNLVDIMKHHLKILNSEGVKMSQIPERLFNGVFQLTSILRCVVSEEKFLSVVSSSGILAELIFCIFWTNSDSDVISNIVRILSVVSVDEGCSELLSLNVKLPEASVKILKNWSSNGEIAVRLTYCLGNLLARSDQFRIKLYQESSAFQSILTLVKMYLSAEICKNISTTSTTTSHDDVLIKAVRVLANWSLNPDIGGEIVENFTIFEIFLQIFGKFLSKEISDELLLCTISAMNNISFYKDHTTDVDESTNKIASSLFQCLNHKNVEIQIEAMKVLGNLTRNDKIRESLNSSVKLLLDFLSHPNDELCYATIGVWINIIFEEKIKNEFISKQGIKSLIEVLEEREDILIGFTTCQVLWNLIISESQLSHMPPNHMYESIGLGQVERSRIITVLNERITAAEIQLQTMEIPAGNTTGNLDDNSNFDEYEEQDAFYEICDNFTQVGASLIEKLDLN